MTRRNLLGNLLTFTAAQPLLTSLSAARSRIGKNRVSAVTDEIGGTPSEAMAFAQRFNLQWLELRKVPGMTRDYASLTFPELKRQAAELARSRSGSPPSTPPPPLPNPSPQPPRSQPPNSSPPAGVITVASPQSPAGIDWNPASTPEQPPAGRLLNVRIPAALDMNWRRILESLERGNYPGQICLQTAPDHAEDAMRGLMHFIGEL